MEIVISRVVVVLLFAFAFMSIGWLTPSVWATVEGNQEIVEDSSSGEGGVESCPLQYDADINTGRTYTVPPTINVNGELYYSPPDC